MASTRTFVASSADRAWADVASASLDLISAASARSRASKSAVRAASACCWDRSLSALSSSAAILRACATASASLDLYVASASRRAAAADAACSLN